jgi:ankyrin repeat protein
MGRTEAVELLIAQGAGEKDIAVLNRDLFAAVGNGDLEKVKELITRGAEVNAKHGTSGGSPLHFAVLAGNKDMVELLIRSGAEVNMKNILGQTPFDLAQIIGNQEMIELLTKYGGKSSGIQLQIPEAFLRGLGEGGGFTLPGNRRGGTGTENNRN